MTCISPRDSAGFSMFAAFIEPSAVARADDVVDLVDHENDVCPCSLTSIDKPEDTRLELSAGTEVPATSAVRSTR